MLVVGREMLGEFTEERISYLDALAEDYGIDKEVVYALADLLGPNEDYDGLVTSLEDFEYFY